MTKKFTRDDLIRALKHLGACRASIKWIRETDGTPYELWKKCERGDWVAWLAEEVICSRSDWRDRPDAWRICNDDISKDHPLVTIKEAWMIHGRTEAARKWRAEWARRCRKLVKWGEVRAYLESMNREVDRWQRKRLTLRRFDD